MKRLKSIIICFLLLPSLALGMLCRGSFLSHAATFDDLNKSEVFLKQQTGVTCTLSSAAMLMRRTAIAAGYYDWNEITEASIKPTAWKDGVGLLWNFTCYNMTMGHGYFDSTKDKKQQILALLEQYPQGIVVYNPGNGGQTHAVFMCDYDESYDIFYVADPANSVASGRIPLIESSIVGGTQAQQLENFDAYWFISSPKVTVSGSSGSITAPSADPNADSQSFDSSKQRIHGYYVVTTDAASGAALRYYPSGSSAAGDYVKKGDILYVTYSGVNSSGALWFKLNRGLYIYASNLTSFEDYSQEISKFNSTAELVGATYSLASRTDTKVSLRIEPSEGNNIIASVANGKNVYITHTGENSAGAKWCRTGDGYYIKAQDLKYVADGEQGDCSLNVTLNIVTGSYSSEPIADNSDSEQFMPADYIITASALNIRRSPVDGEIIGVIPKDAVVTVEDVLSNWGYVEYQGKAGWISMEYAQLYSPTVTPLQIKSMSLSAASLSVGEQIKLTVNLTEDVNAFYSFSVLDANAREVYASPLPTTSNVISYTVTDAGKYYFCVSVTAADSRSCEGNSAMFSVYGKLDVSALIPDVGEMSYVGDEITWTSYTAYHSAESQYEYTLLRNGEEIAGDTTNFNTFSFTPELSGEYVLSVVCTTSNSRSERVTSEPVTVFDSLKIDSVTLSSASVGLNSSVTCTVESSGGAGESKYSFALYNNGALVSNSGFTDENTLTFRFESSGEYVVFCTVRDELNMTVTAFSEDVSVLEVVLGDIDGDNSVTAKDARLALRASANLEALTAAQLAAGDVNGDGRVTASDARKILRFSAKLDEF